MAKRTWNGTLAVSLGAAAFSAFALRAAIRRGSRLNLRGKAVVIMGGTRGLGLDMAREFARKGSRVAVCARDADEVARVRTELEGRAVELYADVCDASDEADVARFIQNVQDRFDTIDVLVTNAATIQVGPVEAMTTKDFEDALESIFWTTYYPTMAVLPAMRRRKAGRIVHITSFGGKVAQPHLLPYCTAKFAATGFSEGLRAEVAKDGICITTITPGLLRTGAETNAPVKGKHDKEYAWFAAGLRVPFVSMASERAAQRIIAAAEMGASERTLSPAVHLLSVVNAIAPGLVASVLAFQNKHVFPDASGVDTRAKRGHDAAIESPSKAVRLLDRMGRANAERHHAYPGPKSM